MNLIKKNIFLQKNFTKKIYKILLKKKQKIFFF